MTSAPASGRFDRIPAIAWSSLLGLLAVCLLFLLTIAHDRETLVARSDNRAEEEALILADHAARLFDAAELALTAVTDESRTMSWTGVQNSRPLWQRVRRLADRLPYVEAFWLYGPGGQLHLTSLTFPAPPLNVAAQDFFAIHSRGNVGADVHVSDAIRNPDGRSTFRVSRRLEDDAGRFRGIASLTVEIEFFGRFYESLSLPPGSEIAVLRSDDLALLVQHGTGSQSPAPGLLRQRAIEFGEAGRLRARSPEDGIERVYAYRRVPGFPLLITVSIPMNMLHDQWLAQVAWRAPMALGAIAALATVTWLGFYQVRRQRDFQAQLEHRVAERTADLNRANQQLEALVHEVHHRVNNNLQIVVSLMALQAARVVDSGGSRALRQSIGRIHTLSLVHQTLYGTGAMVELPLRDYLERLARDIGDLYGRTDVAVTVAGDNPVLPLDTLVPVALIVHEGLCNALRHAFPNSRHGCIRIATETANGVMSLIVADDGIGMPSHFDWAEAGGVGSAIIRSLAAQVGGEAEFRTGDTGTRLVLRLPAPPVTRFALDPLCEARLTAGKGKSYGETL
jgi:two-component sensor histidine kinase